jgi:hypothetical protein
MLVGMVFREKLRLNVENAIEIESVPTKHLA